MFINRFQGSWSSKRMRCCQYSLWPIHARLSETCVFRSSVEHCLQAIEDGPACFFAGVGSALLWVALLKNPALAQRPCCGWPCLKTLLLRKVPSRKHLELYVQRPSIKAEKHCTVLS